MNPVGAFLQNLIKRCMVCALLFAIAPAASGAATPVTLTGAGATLPYPIYAKWAQLYQQKTHVGLNYQSIGSGGGIKQIMAATVDFGASDKPLPIEALNKAKLIQFPAIIGGVVAVINLDGIKPGEIKLTGELLADIFIGKVTKWNAPALVALNPVLASKNIPITVVRRADGSGTTFHFTHYLSTVSPEWAQKVGSDTAVQWPIGIGGKGNEGVASYVQRIKGAIGYIEYAYAKRTKLSYTQLQNSAGTFLTPSDACFSAAAAHANWQAAKGFYAVLTNQPGANSWPITAASFILLQQTQSNPATGKHILAFFDWAFQHGQPAAHALDYATLPAGVVNQIHAYWKTTLKTRTGQPVWP